MMQYHYLYYFQIGFYFKSWVPVNIRLQIQLLIYNTMTSSFKQQIYKTVYSTKYGCKNVQTIFYKVLINNKVSYWCVKVFKIYLTWHTVILLDGGVRTNLDSCVAVTKNDWSLHHFPLVVPQASNNKLNSAKWVYLSNFQQSHFIVGATHESRLMWPLQKILNPLGFPHFGAPQISEDKLSPAKQVLPWERRSPGS